MKIQETKKYKYRYDIAIAVIIILLVIFFLVAKDSFGVLSDREQFQEFIKSFGVFAPLAIILVIIAEVIIAPIPGFVPIISAGFIFGTIAGSIYTLIGNVIGSIIVFSLARKYGKYLILRLVEETRLDKYEQAVRRRENILLAIFYPGFSN